MTTVAPAKVVSRTSMRVALSAALVLTAFTIAHPSAAHRNLIWKATGQKGTVYLVGSMHLLTKDSYPLSPALDTAFNASTLLVEEIDYAEMLAPAAQLQMLTRGMLPPDQSLDKVLSPATMAATEKRLAAAGMPLAPVKMFKPWLLALTLMAQEWQKAGFDANLGLDRHFYDRARADGKAVQGLETVDFQIGQFDAMTFEEQDRLLASTLKELDTQIPAIAELAQAWQAGDTATIERILLRDLKAEARLYDRLLVDRNRAWLPKIEALFSRGTPAFVVVGAAHLVGPDGLVAMLRARGFTVEQL